MKFNLKTLFLLVAVAAIGLTVAMNGGVEFWYQPTGSGLQLYWDCHRVAGFTLEFHDGPRLP